MAACIVGVALCSMIVVNMPDPSQPAGAGNEYVRQYFENLTPGQCEQSVFSLKMARDRSAFAFCEAQGTEDGKP